MTTTPSSPQRNWRTHGKSRATAARGYLHTHLFAAWSKRPIARRFAISWIGFWVFLALLIGLQIRALKPYYLTTKASSGGVYSEGIVGSISTINPVLAESGANADATRLVFNGLTRYDANHKLVGDLADHWEISPDGRVYTFKLRPNIKWQDGQPFTANDVAFTVNLIQNPDSHSQQAEAWKGVTTEVKDPQTIVMTLPVRYEPFLATVTTGIVPRHILESQEPAGLRVSSFNQQPVGTGPFKVTNFNTDNGSVTLAANEQYFGGRPKLDGIMLKVYPEFASMQTAFRKHQIMGMSRVPNSLSDDLGSGTSLHKLQIPEQVGLFMSNKKSVLSDPQLRQAVNVAINRIGLSKDIMHGSVTPTRIPVDGTDVVAAEKYPVQPANVAEAQKLLDAAGWKKGSNGLRQKDGKPLNLHMVTVQTTDYNAVSTYLQQTFKALGIGVQIDATDTQTLQRAYIQPRAFDLLLYGINLGADGDPYPYWHSSQAKDPGLNVSQYSSAAADKALEAERATSDNQVRQVRLASFLTAWTTDTPSAMLYMPTYLYATSPNVHGIDVKQIVEPADRFSNVTNWTLQTESAPKL